MSAAQESIEVPLAREQLISRWCALHANPMFEELAAKIELTEWGEILMSPVSKSHGLAAMRIAQALHNALGGHTMAEVGVATSIGVRAPDVAWCSARYLSEHPEELPLISAPEICVEIASASNALPKLREKALAYVEAGATEAWIVFPTSGAVEIYGDDGRREKSVFAVGLENLTL